MPMLDRTHRDDGGDGFSGPTWTRCDAASELARRDAGLRWQTDQMLEQGLLRGRTVATETPRRFRYRDLWNVTRSHSALMLPVLITLAHFSVSSAMSLPKSAGEPGSTAPPRSASRTLIMGSARAALTSLLSLSTISAGVPFGAPNPNHWLVSKPGRNSLTVGMSGSISQRVALVTANARSFPALMYPTESAGPVNMTCTCPPIRSAVAGPPPR